jgi:hypothetical protein
MGFNVSLYTFSKKINSTARPSAPIVTYSCVLKEPCGILNPVIALNLGKAYSPYARNYAYIPDFDRYYFVKEWTFQNGLWYASLEVDALASWRDSIGASSCYILRSSAIHDGTILDTTYPATNITTLEESQGTTPWETDDIQNGMFVVGVAGQNTTYYLFTYTGLQLFFDYLFSDMYAADLTDNWSGVFPQLKAQTNPLQYITQVMWIPFTTFGTDVSTIRVGWVDVPVAAWRVDGSGIRSGQSDFILRNHPQSDRGSYLNNAPYSHYMLFYPPWGTIPLDADVCANAATISALWNVDLRTGQGTLVISAGDGETTSHIMSWTHSQVGVHYQVSQVINKGYGIGNTFLPAISTAANVLSGNVAGIASTAAAEIGNFAASKVPSATTIGSNGGINALRGYPALQYEFKNVVDEDNAHRGKPLCTVCQISSIPGYIVVANAYISLAATQIEKNAIISFMEGGFYYE